MRFVMIMENIFCNLINKYVADYGIKQQLPSLIFCLYVDTGIYRNINDIVNVTSWYATDKSSKFIVVV